MDNDVKDRITSVFEDKDKITKALSDGVNEALKLHKKAGNPVVSWKNGKIVWIEPGDIIINEQQ